MTGNRASRGRLASLLHRAHVSSKSGTHDPLTFTAIDMRARTSSNVSDSTSAATNRVLRALSARERRAIAARLERVSLIAGQALYEPGHTLSHVYFPDDCVISHLCCPDAHQGIEVAMVGREGLVGQAALLGVPTTVTRVVVQIPGTATRAPVDALAPLFAESRTFRLAITRFAQLLFDQVTLCAACNVGHSPFQRCARWILMIHDRVDGHEFPVTQEFLAYMLGTSRQTVSAVTRRLTDKALVEHRRGRVRLVNRRGLERLACPCYEALSDRLRAVLA